MAIKPTSRHGRERPPRIAAPVGNSILASLLANEYKHLLPRLEPVTLKRHQVIYRADQRIDWVYFPEEAVVAMVDRMRDGRTTEVGIIGREGIVGINIFLGGVATPDRAIVQLPGRAMRMSSKDLRKELRFGSPLQRLLLDYARTFLAVISQSVACSQHHTIVQRLARCLLTMNDYTDSGEILLDQSEIANLLGVRRVGVSAAARELRSAAVVRYSRGCISILDTAELGKKSCECYGFIRKQYKHLRSDLPRLLTE